MKKSLIVAALCWIPLRALGAECGFTVIGTVNESSTLRVTMSMCDYSSTAASTNCPDGGALISASDLTQLTYKMVDRDTGKVLLSTVTVDPDSNPYSYVIPTGNNDIVGACSTTTTTACVDSTECPTGETCTYPSRRMNQVHYLTGTYTWVSGVKAYQCDFNVTNLDAIP